ncbi:hypothetical protein V2J09_000234 [Rumex salicifolius]
MLPMTISEPKRITRPVAGFAPSPWGDRFLNYTPPDAQAIEAQREMAKDLKEKVRRELRSIGDKSLMEQLRLIDLIERLGVDYHFKKEIDDALLHVYETPINPSSDALVITSLRFRLLRQHGFAISSGSNGSLKEEVADDIHGILELYEACYVRVHGDDILDEVLPLTISKLNNTISGKVTTHSLLEESIKHALYRPLQKRVIRYDCAHYIQIYAKEDDTLHNKSLLKFAKLDFNLLQVLHRGELSELCRYWKRIDFLGNLPLRDKMVEAHAWSISTCLEPHYSLGRKITCFGGHAITSIDDIYDAYTTLEEAEIFTQAVERWDKSCLDKLPKDLRWFYERTILNGHEELERHLAPIGRSQYVEYAKQETYLTEARWRHNKYVPTLDEYMQNDLYRNVGYIGTMVYAFLGLDITTHHDFEWVCNLAPPVKAVCYILRILNDIGGKKFDESRGVSGLFLECYMKQYGLTFDEACKELYKKVDELWKDINQCMTRPGEVAVPVYNIIINMGRAVECIYGGGEDGYTLANHEMKQTIKTMYIDPIPM